MRIEISDEYPELEDEIMVRIHDRGEFLTSTRVSDEIVDEAIEIVIGGILTGMDPHVGTYRRTPDGPDAEETTDGPLL